MHAWFVNRREHSLRLIWVLDWDWMREMPWKRGYVKYTFWQSGFQGPVQEADHADVFLEIDDAKVELARLGRPKEPVACCVGSPAEADTPAKADTSLTEN